MKEAAKYLLVASFFLCLLGCSSNFSEDVCKFVVPKDSIRNGDLVFRLGRSVESRFVESAGKECGFSHVGIMVWAGDTLKVVHAVPGERKNDSIVCEPVESFLCDARAQRAGFFKVICGDSVANRAAVYGLKRYRDGCIFDHDYNLDDDGNVYCTELVWRAYKESGIDITEEKRTEISTFFVGSGVIISPQDLLGKTRQMD